jgi:aspartyl-tRNA(Asn)/glutamyl-tRNA(Gln) amidotransferase subunit C
MRDEFDVEKLALLTRIKFNSKEKEKFQKEFESILDYVSKLKGVDISEINDKEAVKTAKLENVAREDKEAHKPAEFSEDLLKEVPSLKKGYVKVKHILE